MSADDLLFEPFTRPTAPRQQNINTGATISGDGIIVVPGNYTRIEINLARPPQPYLDAASDVINHAVLHHPGMVDVRNCPHPLPAGFLNMVEIVNRFEHGNDEMWISRPHIMSPQLFRFSGRFGHFKFWRMPQQFIPSQHIIWFWLDTDSGQLAAIDLGILCMHPNLKMYHAFCTQQDATTYFRS